MILWLQIFKNSLWILEKKNWNIKYCNKVAIILIKTNINKIIKKWDSKYELRENWWIGENLRFESKNRSDMIAFCEEWEGCGV